jgi:transposase
MELLTILNRCHRFRGFVYQYAHFSADKKSIEVAVRPRKGSVAVCSRCHLPAPGYNQLTERRFEFIPLWGFSFFFCTPCGAWTAAAAASWLSKRSPGATANAH